MPRASDLELLGLEVDSSGLRSRFHLTPRLSRHDGSLYVSIAPRDGALGTMGLWSRLRAPDATMTPAAIAFLADMVPVAIARGASKQGAGTSLDNTMRFGPVSSGPNGPDREWVLLELQGQMATGGYGHGTVHVWSPDGTLLATGSQTANMVYIFEGDVPG